MSEPTTATKTRRDAPEPRLQEVDLGELASLQESLQRWNRKLELVRLEVSEAITAYEKVLKRIECGKKANDDQRQCVREVIAELKLVLEGINWSNEDLDHIGHGAGVLGYRFWLGKIYEEGLDLP